MMFSLILKFLSADDYTKLFIILATKYPSWAHLWILKLLLPICTYR